MIMKITCCNVLETRDVKIFVAVFEYSFLELLNIKRRGDTHKI